ncbi:MAG: histidine kinase N-terminal 7TM domain-containing protein [Methanothrix sp.]
MSWQLTPYFLPLLISAAISSAIAVYSWRYRTSPGTVSLAFLMTAAAIWSAAYAMELGSAQLSSKLFFTGIEYMGIVSLPLAWLVLSLEFSGRNFWISYRRIGLLAVIPVITVLLVWTNDYHKQETGRIDGRQNLGGVRCGQRICISCYHNCRGICRQSSRFQSFCPAPSIRQ